VPDIKEVFEMVTKQTPPRLDALDRQRERQDRYRRNRKVGAIAVVAVIALVVIAFARTMRPTDGARPADTDQFLPPPPGPPAIAGAEFITDHFVQAFGTFHARKAMLNVADGANLGGLIDGQVTPNLEGLSTELRLLRAMGYSQSVSPCRTDPAGSGFSVECPIRWSGIRSDEIGRGPYPGVFSFQVEDGLIVWGTLTRNTDRFSPQVWEPFLAWVSANHPDDVDVMYVDGGSNYRLTDASIRLWRLRTKEYVRAVQQGAA
jgi:hypothetical protein